MISGDHTRRSPRESLSSANEGKLFSPLHRPQTEELKSDSKRRTSLQVQLPKLSSNEALNAPASPGLGSSLLTPTTADSSKMSDIASSDKSPYGGKLTRKESYKAQRKSYREEKKRVADELVTALKDPSVIVLADWLKVRGTLKGWTKLYCILKPGLLLLYKSAKTKSNHWVGTVLLNACQVIERPSKKDGFCFKLFHPLEQSIWAPKGPERETIGAVVQPLPTSYLIFRAPSQAAGKCWLDALELSLRCSSLLVRSVSRPGGGAEGGSRSGDHDHEYTRSSSHDTQWSDAERHFVDHDLGGGGLEQEQMSVTETESETSIGGLHLEKDNDTLHTLEAEDGTVNVDDGDETVYIPRVEDDIADEQQGEQVEELAEEHKSLIWYIVKQVRPGMDLSKVVLPTFILEPRSFLDKLADSYYHADILSKAVLEDDAFTRMKTIVQWYLSGFYKKPKGPKKPYNPVLGETFRCYWKHPNGSRTFYIAEQVSHHPPVSAFFVTNRHDGFCLSGSILAKSKFYGNSTSAILDGVAVLTLLPRGEDYTITIPYALCKGILMGTLTMELGGKVAIECEKTGYRTELEFKLKPLIGGSDQLNGISGKLKLGKETLAHIDGYWDGVINITDKRTGATEEQPLWNPTQAVRSSRLVRYTVPVEEQEPYESEKLWANVTSAILADDQVKATEEKTILEDLQRAAVKARKESDVEWHPRLFEQNLITGGWEYKHCDLRPWDPRNDLLQYEQNFVICTKTRHRTPMIRTASIVSVEPPSHQVQPLLQAASRSSLSVLKKSRRRMDGGGVSKSGAVVTGAGTATKLSPAGRRQESVSSSQDGDMLSDSSQWETAATRSKVKTKSSHHCHAKLDSRIYEAVKQLDETVRMNGDRLLRLQNSVEQLARVQRDRSALATTRTTNSNYTKFLASLESFLIIAIISLLQLLLLWFFFPPHSPSSRTMAKR